MSENREHTIVKPRKGIIGVIGGAAETGRICETARELGRRIALRGYILICGGLGGVMESASRGAYEKGGEVLGILPGSSASSANPYVTIPVVTSMSHARNAIIARSADVLFALGGRYGTLSEIAHARALGKRVIAYCSWPDISGVEYCDTAEELIGMVDQL